MKAEDLMGEAIELALLGRGAVEPNPRVGALALCEGVVVGRGRHRFYGGAHAEVEALADAQARGAKPDAVVVTMEPCSTPVGVSDKKTPACTETLIAAGVKRVIIGAVDPDPRHQGRGLKTLEAAGIEIEAGVSASRCQAINRPFDRWLGLDRPWTIAKYAMTIDGKTAAATGEARWISGEESRRRTHELRSRCDAVVIGFRTARMDDPLLTVRHVDGDQPVRIVIDPDAEIAVESNLVRSADEHPLWLIVSTDADVDRTERLQDLGVRIVRCAGQDRRLDLLEAWRELRHQGLRRIMVEGGGELLAQLMGCDCIDQILAFVAPKMIGGRAAPTPVGGEGKPLMAEAWRLDEMESERSGEDIAITAFIL